MVEVNLFHKIGAKPFKTVHVPEQWEECTPVQRLLLAEALHLYEDQELLSRAVVIIFDLDEYDLARIDTEVVIEHLFEYAKFITKPYTDQAQLFPKLKVRWTTYYGVTDRLLNITAGEFHFAEQFLGQYYKTKDLSHLYKFMAVLYRPMKKGYDLKLNEAGDPRVKMKYHALDHYAKKIKQHVPIRYVFFTAIWYKACVNQLAKMHPRIFKKDAAKGEAKSNANSGKGFFDLFRMVADTKIYGTFEDVENLLFYNLLTEFETQIDIQEQQQREIDKAKNHGA